MYEYYDYELCKRKTEIHNKGCNRTTMVIVKSPNKEEDFSLMETVPKLPPITGASSYQYSENPYEIDLSFRSLDVVAFQDKRRAGDFIF